MFVTIYIFHTQRVSNDEKVTTNFVDIKVRSNDVVYCLYYINTVRVTFPVSASPLGKLFSLEIDFDFLKRCSSQVKFD